MDQGGQACAAASTRADSNNGVTPSSRRWPLQRGTRHVKLYLYEVAAVFVLQLIIESRRTRVESLSFLPNSLSTDSDKGHSLGHQGRRGAPLTKLVHRLFGSKARPR